MFRQAVYRKVVGPGITPTAGAFALVGIIAPIDFDHRSQLQRQPVAQVGMPAMASPPSIPNLQTIVAINRSARTDPAWRQLFQQALPITPAAAILPGVAFRPQPFYPDFYKPTWNQSYWFQSRPFVVASNLIQVTGGGPRKAYRWTPIKDLPFQRAGVVVPHGFIDDDWLIAAIAAGMTPAEAVLLYAFAQEA